MESFCASWYTLQLFFFSELGFCLPHFLWHFFFPATLENIQGTLGFVFLLLPVSFPPFCRACDLSLDGQHKEQELSERHTCAMEVIPAGKRGNTRAHTNACCCARVNTHFHMHLSYPAKSAQIHAVSTFHSCQCYVNLYSSHSPGL